jgi:acyl carrier protein
MSKEKIIAELEEILEQDAGSLKEDTTLASIPEWDSLAVISFIAAVDEQYGHVLNGDDLQKAKTIGDLVALAQAAA